MDIREESSFAIKDQSGQLEALVSGIGGTVMEFTINGRNIFYPYRITIEDKARGGCPICAPWFSRSARGPQHGFLRDSRHLLKFKSEHSVGFTFVDLQTAGYQWPLIYATMASFKEANSLSLKLKIIRMADDIFFRAPVLPGFHPYFACSDADQVKVIMGNTAYLGFSHQARIVPVCDRKVLIVTPEREIEMSLGQGFRENVAQLVLWTDNPGRYVCVEPILESKNLFDTKKGHHLSKKGRLDLEVTLKVL